MPTSPSRLRLTRLAGTALAVTLSLLAPVQPTAHALPTSGLDQAATRSAVTVKPATLEPGNSSRRVRLLQARLRQIGWFAGDVTGFYGPKTTAAVAGFQRKRGLPDTGTADRRTQRRLHAMTRRPAAAELANRAPKTRLDPRCKVGRVLCVDKTGRTLRWVVDGRVKTTLDARFGGPSTPTREGRFRVYWKSRHHVSSLYNTPMPLAMFFSGGQAVHYSPDFAAVGYNGASHGCVNIRNRAALTRLFDQVRVGDTVIVYRS